MMDGMYAEYEIDIYDVLYTIYIYTTLTIYDMYIYIYT